MNWLHREAVYDVLLAFVGIPIGIWSCYRIGAAFDQFKLSNIVSTAIYVYGFFLALYLFRVLFSYTRWVFPKVELDSERAASPLRHRAIWSAIILAIAAALLYDLAKLLVA